MCIKVAPGTHEGLHWPQEYPCAQGSMTLMAGGERGLGRKEELLFCFLNKKPHIL